MKASFLSLRACAEGIVQPFFALALGLTLVSGAGAVTSQSFKVSATVVKPRRERSGSASYQSGSRVHGVENTAPIPTLIERR